MWLCADRGVADSCAANGGTPFSHSIGMLFRPHAAERKAVVVSFSEYKHEFSWVE